MTDRTSRAARGEIITPPQYRSRSAASKADWLWNELILPTSHPSAELPALEIPIKDHPVSDARIVLSTSKLRETLERDDDLMPVGRRKVIHHRGSVALVELETLDESPFSGLLGAPPDGGAIGLIRISIVGRVFGKAAFTPAFGLKLLVDGHASADLVAMNHTVGQGRDFDVFSNTMTNDLTEEHRELRSAQRLMSRLFSRVSREPRRVLTTHMTGQTRDGNPVGVVTSPRRLVFHPTRDAKAIFPGHAGVDFRRVLAGVPAGTPLYDVEGLTGAPGTSDGALIGRIRSTTGFVSSDGGDRLFFRHVQPPDDLKR